MADHIRGRMYRGAPAGSASERARRGALLTQLGVHPTRPGDRHVLVRTSDTEHGDHPGVLLTADQVEQLGIDLQIRASYLRGVRPPAGPEPDPIAGPDDVPLIPEESPHGR